VSLDVTAMVERARIAAQSKPAGETPDAERERLKGIAAEFESMLLVQVLKDMRSAGSWKDDEDSQDTLGAESLFETLDVELASHLARVKGMGLSKPLEEAFDRMHPHSPSATTPNAQLPTPNSELATPGLGVGNWKLGVDPAASTPKAAKASNPVAAVLRTAAEATVAVPRTVTQLVKPVAGAVTSAFGWRRHPITNDVKFHQGVDLRAAYGQEVQVAAAGRVVFSGDQGGYGATVVVEHQDGTRTRYAHLSARLVKEGDQLAAGAPLGRAGHSGHATGTHLHFEVIAPDGRRVQPEQWAHAGKPAGVTVPRSN
jgi:murein DD-endopeptidase MepM/ murein hydrolase activator NlpD